MDIVQPIFPSTSASNMRHRDRNKERITRRGYCRRRSRLNNQIETKFRQVNSPYTIIFSFSCTCGSIPRFGNILSLSICIYISIPLQICISITVGFARIVVSKPLFILNLISSKRCSFQCACTVRDLVIVHFASSVVVIRSIEFILMDSNRTCALRPYRICSVCPFLLCRRGGEGEQGEGHDGA